MVSVCLADFNNVVVPVNNAQRFQDIKAIIDLALDVLQLCIMSLLLEIVVQNRG